MEGPSQAQPLRVVALIAAVLGAIAGVLFGLRGSDSEPETGPAAAAFSATASERLGGPSRLEMESSGIIIDQPKNQNLPSLMELNRGEIDWDADRRRAAEEENEPEPSEPPSPPGAPALRSPLDLDALLKGGAPGAGPGKAEAGLNRDGFVRKLSGDGGKQQSAASPAAAGPPGGPAAAPDRRAEAPLDPFPQTPPARLDAEFAGRSGSAKGRELMSVDRGGESTLPAGGTAKILERLYQVGKQVHQRSLDTGAPAVLSPEETKAFSSEIGVRLGEKDAKPAQSSIR